MTDTQRSAHLPNSCDVIILGSGFGGSLLATILVRSGQSVVLLDRQRHPRFAIGESSTPLADRTLHRLAQQYRIPEVLPLCAWGSWKQTHPELICGRKRGFTYFDLTKNQDLTVADFDDRRLLVAASRDNEHADTHWLRSDVDQFLCRLAESSGCWSLEDCRYTLQRTAESGGWLVAGTSGDRSFETRAPFVVDATGSSHAVLKSLNIADHTHLLRTNSRSVFAHFSGTATSDQLLREANVETAAFPFLCDDAAVHQVYADGWMWQLRFDDNSLSAGFMIDQRHEAAASSTPGAAVEWRQRIASQPFLSRQFRAAAIIRPDTGLRATGRIQRLAAAAAGPDWAALTNTAGFIDPLHSTGIAHTLFSIERLATILLAREERSLRAERLREYSDRLIDEIRFVDQLVEGCYAALPSFPIWCDWAMLYFAAVTSMEQASGEQLKPVGFLRADDREFRHVVLEARQRLDAQHAANGGLHLPRDAEIGYRAGLREAITPWNHVGLFDDVHRNLYATTACP